MVRELQERAARALPVEYSERVGGWWLHHAPDCSWWVGTAQPHADAGPRDLARRVTAVEEFYGTRDASPCFQISPGACPPELDALLAERGYAREGMMSLQTASIPEVLARTRAGTLRVRLADRLTPAWYEVWHAVHGHYGGDARAERAMLERAAQPVAYASALIGDDVVAAGRAVVDTGWAGLFSVATLPHARGKGAASNILAALAEWASLHDIERMYLQVEPDNIPAVRLYAQSGFEEVCAYHYRCG
ncbi:GNAT family N-acetyltransferase [Spirillospora sp. NPDC127200]